MTPEQITEKYISLAQLIARQNADRNSPNDVDEMLSAAYFGLVKAAAKGDDNKRYIVSRIEGEISQARRENDALSRRDRDIMRFYYLYDGNAAAVAEKLSLDAEFVQRSVDLLSAAYELLQEREEERTHTFERQERFKETLEVCLSILPESTHETFLLFYRDGAKPKDMAKSMDVTQRKVYDRLSEIKKILHENKESLANLLF